MVIEGKVFKYGDDVNTDVIIPARFLNTADPEELKLHCMEDLDADFIKNVSAGDIIVAGKNFGCGSSREHAPVAIKASGISCVIACDFARIFYRNAINTGLPIIENTKAFEEINNGDRVTIDFEKGEIKDLTNGKVFETGKFPEFIENIIKVGGLVSYTKEKYL